MTTYYPAILETGALGGYGVVFPDLPGCVSAGDTQQVAAENAAEALLLHLQGLVEDRAAIPAPSPLDALIVDPEVQEAARILVAVKSMRLERVNVSLDSLLLGRIDLAAERRGQSRSES